jgi:hypothetical protein
MELVTITVFQVFETNYMGMRKYRIVLYQIKFQETLLLVDF